MSGLEIYRLELVFLNPAENRWQMFQEAHASLANSAGAIYRKQAQDALRWIRETLTTLCGDSGVKVADFESEPQEIHLDLGALRGRLHKIAADARRNLTYERELKKIEEELYSTLKLEGIPNDDPVKLVFGALRNNDPVKLKREEALLLVSVLCCARCWDVFGQLSPQEERKVDPLPSPAGIPFFAYSIWYTDTDKSQLHSRAEQALGYNVSLAMHGLKRRDEEKGLYEEKTGYFTVCRDVTSHREAFWYCFYGYLIDALNSRIAGGKRNGGSKPPVHIVCLPLRICGYDHFLQLYVRHEHGGDQKDIEDLDPRSIFYKVKPILKGQFQTGADVNFIPHMKECLRELLVQMHISSFQHHVLMELDEGKPESNLDELFCRHAPNLVKISEIEINKEMSYQYQVDRGILLKKWGPGEPTDQIPLSERFKKSGEHIARINGGHLKAFVPWEREFDGLLGPLFRGTGEQRLTEQYQWLKWRIKRRKELQKIADHLVGFRQTLEKGERPWEASDHGAA